ncbi:MAG: zinc ribbon domain-containing protein [Proteobacteria bacterium]|nr:zinc ribbon domain-containing protein [Cystobacterineae bacterium]MCL2313772.1 zinc ribbon domain-containing protein [Pseudomonadota bacterium]
MPIYEYLCENCGAHLSLLQKVDAPIPPTCENCSAPNTLKKRISMSAFHLKGGGWYSELYASPSKTQETKNETSPSPAPPSPCATCPAASSNSGCAGAQKP